MVEETKGQADDEVDPATDHAGEDPEPIQVERPISKQDKLKLLWVSKRPVKAEIMQFFMTKAA